MRHLKINNEMELTDSKRIGERSTKGRICICISAFLRGCLFMGHTNRLTAVVYTIKCT
jgi:hypothetical protein